MLQPPQDPTYDPNFAYGRYTDDEQIEALSYASTMAASKGFPETDERYDAYRQSYLREKSQSLLTAFSHMSVSSPVSTPSTQFSHTQRQNNERTYGRLLREADEYAATFSSSLPDPQGNIARGAHDEYLCATPERREALWTTLRKAEKQNAERIAEKAILDQIEQEAEAYANFSVALTDNFGNGAFYQAAYDRYMDATPEARAALSEALSRPAITPNMEPVSSHTPPLSFRAPSSVRDSEVSEAVYVQRIVYALNGHLTADDARDMYRSALKDSALPSLIRSLIEIEESNADSNSPRRR